MSFEEEKGNIQNEAIKAAKIIINNPEVKEDYEHYINACKEYNVYMGDNEKFSKFKDRVSYDNGILAIVYVNRIH